MVMVKRETPYRMFSAGSFSLVVKCIATADESSPEMGTFPAEGPSCLPSRAMCHNASTPPTPPKPPTSLKWNDDW